MTCCKVGHSRTLIHCLSLSLAYINFRYKNYPIPLVLSGSSTKSLISPTIDPESPCWKDLGRTARSQADRYGTTAPYPRRWTLSIYFHRSNSLSVARCRREESLRRHLRDVMLIKDLQSHGGGTAGLAMAASYSAAISATFPWMHIVCIALPDDCRAKDTEVRS